MSELCKVCRFHHTLTDQPVNGHCTKWQEWTEHHPCMKYNPRSVEDTAEENLLDNQTQRFWL